MDRLLGVMILRMQRGLFSTPKKMRLRSRNLIMSSYILRMQIDPTTNRSFRACKSCRISKVRCDRGDPCSRCQRLQILCETEPSQEVVTTRHPIERNKKKAQPEDGEEEKTQMCHRSYMRERVQDPSQDYQPNHSSHLLIQTPNRQRFGGASQISQRPHQQVPTQLQVHALEYLANVQDPSEGLGPDYFESLRSQLAFIHSHEEHWP